MQGPTRGPAPSTSAPGSHPGVTGECVQLALPAVTGQRHGLGAHKGLRGARAGSRAAPCSAPQEQQPREADLRVRAHRDALAGGRQRAAEKHLGKQAPGGACTSF